VALSVCFSGPGSIPLELVFFFAIFATIWAPFRALGGVARVHAPHAAGAMDENGTDIYSTVRSTEQI
jgi:hypothetical protein